MTDQPRGAAGLDDPADTRMMGILHSALRRDLVRLRTVLGTPQAAEPARRTALAEHVLWLVDVLHLHHSGEDDGLYPLVLRRNPDAAPGAADGRRPRGDHPAMDSLERAPGPTWPTGRPDEALVAAIDGCAPSRRWTVRPADVPSCRRTEPWIDLRGGP